MLRIRQNEMNLVTQAWVAFANGMITNNTGRYDYLQSYAGTAVSASATRGRASPARPPIRLEPPACSPAQPPAPAAIRATSPATRLPVRTPPAPLR